MTKPMSGTGPSVDKDLKATFHFFGWPFMATGLGFCLAAWLGWITTGSTSGLVAFFLIGSILAVLEISLSFDNAVVNANTLKRMTPL